MRHPVLSGLNALRLLKEEDAMSASSLSEAADVAQIVMATCAGLALLGVAVEYLAQKARSRLEHAQAMIEVFDRDEMIAFAVTCLDWAGGLIPIPSAWREAVGASVVRPDPAAVRTAVERVLNKETAESPLLLLYRHAFVRLFNHLERIEDLRRAIGPSDVRPIAWIAQQLASWQYGDPDTFAGAIDGWYDNGKLRRLIELLRRMAGPAMGRAEGPITQE
jgi:hypothetical protein